MNRNPAMAHGLFGGRPRKPSLVRITNGTMNQLQPPVSTIFVHTTHAYLESGSFWSRNLTKSFAVLLIVSHSGDGKSNLPVLTESKISVSDSP